MNRTNMNRYFFACSLIVLSSNAWADQPPSWQPFSVKSENGKFVATVAPQDEEKPALPWESAYRIEVRSVEGDQPGPAVWNRRYAFSGYEGGLLSNDGAFFVYVDYWYRHSAAAVVIYSKAGSCYLTGEQLGLKERSLQKTASHRLWLNGESKFVELQGKTVALLVPTVQGEKTITLAPTVSFNGAACIGANGPE